MAIDQPRGSGRTGLHPPCTAGELSAMELICLDLTKASPNLGVMRIRPAFAWKALHYVLHAPQGRHLRRPLFVSR